MKAPRRPENRPPQLRDETVKPKLNSYEHETNETGISLQKKCVSYDYAPRIARNCPQKHSPSYGTRP